MRLARKSLNDKCRVDFRFLGRNWIGKYFIGKIWFEKRQFHDEFQPKSLNSTVGMLNFIKYLISNSKNSLKIKQIPHFPIPYNFQTLLWPIIIHWLVDRHRISSLYSLAALWIVKMRIVWFCFALFCFFSLFSFNCFFFFSQLNCGGPASMNEQTKSHFMFVVNIMLASTEYLFPQSVAQTEFYGEFLCNR